MIVPEQDARRSIQRRSPALIIVAASVALVLAAGAGIWALLGEPPSQARRLPDGSVLKLVGVSYGKKHPLVEKKLWQTLLGPVLPPDLQGKKLNQVGMPRERLVLWFWPGNRPQAPELGRWIEAVDEHGCRFGPGGERGFLSISQGDNNPYRMGSLDVFPRRAGRFGLRVYERSAQAPVAEFAVANPRPGPYPTWKPEPIPVDKQRGGLRILLTGLTTGLTRERLASSRQAIPLDELQSSIHPAQYERPWSRATFRLVENGAPTDRWRLTNLTVRDATGNESSYRDWWHIEDPPVRAAAGSAFWYHVMDTECFRSRTDRDGSLCAAFPGLCAREAAWKLRVTFAYAGPAERLPPELRWTPPRVVVPRPGQSVGLTHATTLKGVTLKLQSAVGRGAFGRDEPLLEGASGRVFVTSSPRDGLSLALRAKDDRGREVVCSHGGSMFMGPYHKWWFDLKIPPGAKTMTLTFLGWKGRTVEFLARPTPA